MQITDSAIADEGVKAISTLSGISSAQGSMAPLLAFSTGQRRLIR